jgi:hypothetical protein
MVNELLAKPRRIWSAHAQARTRQGLKINDKRPRKLSRLATDEEL